MSLINTYISQKASRFGHPGKLDSGFKVVRLRAGNNNSCWEPQNLQGSLQNDPPGNSEK